ncbi:MAG: SAM-dependent methyltransferase, partial [Pleurocapsa sp. MO_192.B19]|nr:SAM-dependent methyltransferase [Pleurocapsa sp. MO_192.B19]
MSLPEFPHSQMLKKILLNQIDNSSEKRITFAEYMAQVLYNQHYGYYNSGVVSIGAKGDFFTSSSLGQDFGELLAVQLTEMWQNLGCPHPFYLVEMGGGNGELGQDILSYIQKHSDDVFIKALKYIIIEQSTALIKAQQELLTSLSCFDREGWRGSLAIPNRGVDLTWKTWSDLADNSIEGCFFSNELVDAFPVHLVTK